MGAIGGENKERGQASAEYAGIIFVVVALIAALLIVGMSDIGDAIIGKITDAIAKIGE